MVRIIDTCGRYKVTCERCRASVDYLVNGVCSLCARGTCKKCGAETSESRDTYCDLCQGCWNKEYDNSMKASGPVVGKKFDDDKNPLSLLPFEALDGVGLVLKHGARKYAAHNWRAGMSWSRLISALLRHIFAFARGEDIDPESGLPHLDHAACCILFLSSYQKTKNGTDDRFTVEVKDGNTAD